MWVTLAGSRIHGRNRNIFNQLWNSSYQLDTSARPSPQMPQDQNQNFYYSQSQLSQNFLLQSTFYLLPEPTFLYILIWWLKECWFSEEEFGLSTMGRRSYSFFLACLCTTSIQYTQREEEGIPALWGLKLLMAVSHHAGAGEHRSSGRGANALNHWATAVAPIIFVFKFVYFKGWDEGK